MVKALSEWVNVTVYRDGYEFNQRFEKGISKGELSSKQLVKPYKKGTTICFKPDNTIFTGGIDFEYQLFIEIKRIGLSKWGVKIVFRDERKKLQMIL